MNSSAGNKKVSIVIPVFNEEATIAQVIQSVLDLKLNGLEKEIIVVDDGSNDQTESQMKPFHSQIQFLKHPRNQGKGAAVRTALTVASGDIIAIQDADLEYRPDDLVHLIREFDDPATEVVYGSRNLNPERKGYPLYVLGVTVLTSLTNWLFGCRLTDIYTCYKLFRSSVIKSVFLASRGFEFEAEITAKILRKGVQIKEIPIRYYPRTFKEGKKIRFRDGVIGGWTLIKNRFCSEGN